MMTNEEREKHIRIASMLIGAIHDLIRPMLMYQIEKDVAEEALENYIKMLEQQPCEDAISRQAVLDKKELVELDDGQSFYCINPKDVETLPSVTPTISKMEQVEDCISRTKAIEIVNNPIEVDLELALRRLPSVTPQQTRWIPVSERLPEIGQRILVTYNQEDEVKIDITNYTKHGFLLSVVTAWMPLPQRYKAEKEENVCKDCYYNDGEVHAECVICDKAESEVNNDD